MLTLFRISGSNAMEDSAKITGLKGQSRGRVWGECSSSSTKGGFKNVENAC